MAEIAGEAGAPVLEVEYLTGWGTAADRDAAQQDKERTVFQMARTFGVRPPERRTAGEAAARRHRWRPSPRCAIAPATDLTVALEFMPYSGVPDLATAWQIARRTPGGPTVR